MRTHIDVSKLGSEAPEKRSECPEYIVRFCEYFNRTQDLKAARVFFTGAKSRDAFVHLDTFHKREGFSHPAYVWLYWIIGSNIEHSHRRLTLTRFFSMRSIMYWLIAYSHKLNCYPSLWCRLDSGTSEIMLRCTVPLPDDNHLFFSPSECMFGAVAYQILNPRANGINWPATLGTFSPDIGELISHCNDNGLQISISNNPTHNAPSWRIHFEHTIGELSSWMLKNRKLSMWDQYLQATVPLATRDSHAVRTA